jgi:hypothetical protein
MARLVSFQHWPLEQAARSGGAGGASRRITVFISPTSLRAGLLDVSVLVQDVASGKPQLDLLIVVSAYPIPDLRRKVSVPATTDAATNKLFHAAELNLPEAVTWRIEVVVDGDQQKPAICFEVFVAPPPPWLDMSLWIGWPLLAIGLFACHQWLVHRRRPFSGRSDVLADFSIYHPGHITSLI